MFQGQVVELMGGGGENFGIHANSTVELESDVTFSVPIIPVYTSGTVPS